jgi:hypothetical protein
VIRNRMMSEIAKIAVDAVAVVIAAVAGALVVAD